MDVLATDGELTLRRMTEADYGVMSRWLSDPRVLAWFGGRDRPMSRLDIAEKYAPRLAGRVPTTCLIAEIGEEPVGYIQFYRWKDHHRDASVLGLSTIDDPYGLDLFVGRPGLWGTGVGTRMLRLLLAHLFDTIGTRRVALAAMAHNYRAQRAYRKVGFRRVRLVPDAEMHEGVVRDELLMVVDRASFAATTTPPAGDPGPLLHRP